MNNFAFLGVETPVWQGAKVQEYVNISSFRNAVRRDESAVKNVKLFIYRPYIKRTVPHTMLKTRPTENYTPQANPSHQRLHR